MEPTKQNLIEIAAYVTDDGFQIDDDIYRSGKWLWKNYPNYAEVHDVFNSSHHYYMIV